MTNKKLTKDEIKIALKHCANIHCICSDCILFEPEDDECQCCKDLKLNTLDLINQYEAEIKSKQETIDMFTDIGKLYSEIKAEAIKEFAERLKERYWQEDGCWLNIDICEDIDNLLKEMGVE